MDDFQHRVDTMQTDVMLIAAAGLSLMQGMPWSPVLLPVTFLLKPFFAGTFLSSPIVLTYLASMFASALTLVLAGVPAALYERIKGLDRSTPMSVGIWMVGVIGLIVLPHLLVR